MSTLIPKPVKEEMPSGTVDLTKGLCISENTFDGTVTAAFLQRITRKGITVTGNVADTQAVAVSIVKAELGADAGNEAYELVVSAGEIVIRAADRSGVINALTSLYQLIAPDMSLPFVVIRDQPRLSYRGIHIDAARHFFPIDVMKKIIEEVSLVKINKLHWHLSDDQGFRIFIDCYPELAEQSGALYYSKADIRDIVAFASVRGVEIIPEIDMPGHTRAIVAAHPELSCKGEKVALATCGGIYPAILCPGKDETFAFIQNLLDEVVPLFPGTYFHIGGDEAPKHNWKTCPACQKRIQEEGLKNETELQGYFSKRVADYIRGKYGKKIICWNDSLDSVKHLDGSETVQYWTLEHRNHLSEFVLKGGHVIYSDMFELYYDYPAAMSPMKRSYTARPVIDEIDYSGSSALLGYECCNWSEYTSDGESLERKIFPRLYAMAENAWSDVTDADYAGFKQRLAVYKKTITTVTWGSGDPKGVKKQMEKMAYAMTMSKGMPEDVRAQTVEAAQMSDEFMVLFQKKMLLS